MYWYLMIGNASALLDMVFALRFMLESFMSTPTLTCPSSEKVTLVWDAIIKTARSAEIKMIIQRGLVIESLLFFTYAHSTIEQVTLKDKERFLSYFITFMLFVGLFYSKFQEKIKLKGAGNNAKPSKHAKN